MSSDQTGLQLDEGLLRVFNSLLTGVHTATIGQIVSYDSNLKTCSVQPVLKKLYEYNEEATQLPVLEDVPVIFPGSGDYWLTFDVAEDSYVLLIANERSIDNFMATGGIVDPEADRKFQLTDALAIPGLLPAPNAPSVVAASGMALRNKAGTNGFELSSTSAKMKFGAFSIEIDATGIHIVGNVDVNGTVTATDFIIVLLSLLTHVHTTSEETTSGPIGPP